MDCNAPSVFHLFPILLCYLSLHLPPSWQHPLTTEPNLKFRGGQLDRVWSGLIWSGRVRVNPYVPDPNLIRLFYWSKFKTQIQTRPGLILTWLHYCHKILMIWSSMHMHEYGLKLFAWSYVSSLCIVPCLISSTYWSCKKDKFFS